MHLCEHNRISSGMYTLSRLMLDGWYADCPQQILATCNCRIFLLGSIVCISLLNPSTYVNTCSFALQYVLPCRESSHMTSSKVCKKVTVASNGKHVTLRAYLACRAHDLMRGRPQSSQKNLSFTYMRSFALFAHRKCAFECSIYVKVMRLALQKRSSRECSRSIF